MKISEQLTSTAKTSRILFVTLCLLRACLKRAYMKTNTRNFCLLSNSFHCFSRLLVLFVTVSLIHKLDPHCYDNKSAIKTPTPQVYIPTNQYQGNLEAETAIRVASRD